MEIMMNPMNLVSLLKGRNPQELVMSMIQGNNINDPMINDLIKYAQNNDIENVNKIAENYFNQRGMNFQKELNNLMSMLK